MAISPDYYIAPDADTGGTRTGTLAQPYRLSDLNIGGGATKTVASNDWIGAIATANKFALTQDLSLPAGTLGGKGTAIRGCKADGTYDETRATRATFDMGAYRFFANAAQTIYADLHATDCDTATSQGVFEGDSNGDQGLWYNCKVSIGAGTANANSYAFFNVAGTFGCRWWANVIDDWPATGFRMQSNGSILYNLAKTMTKGSGNVFQAAANDAVIVAAHNVVKTAAGMTAYQTGTRTTFFHNTADAAATGFSIGSGSSWPVIIGNLAVNCSGYGYAGSTSDTSRGLIAWGNCGYNNTSGNADSNWTTASRMCMGNATITDANPTLDSSYTPTTLTGIPTLGEMLSGVATGRNLAGALTLAGAGGGGGVVGPWGTVR